MVRFIGDVQEQHNDKFTIWLAGYYDDFHSCRMTLNDNNNAYPDSYDHKLTHYGNLFTGTGYMNFRYKWSFAEREKRNLYYDINERNNPLMASSLQRIWQEYNHTSASWDGYGTFTTAGTMQTGGVHAMGLWEDWGHMNGTKTGELRIVDSVYDKATARMPCWWGGFGYDSSESYTMSFTANAGVGNTVGTVTPTLTSFRFGPSDTLTTESIKNYTRWYATSLSEAYQSNSYQEIDRDTRLVGGHLAHNLGMYEGLGYDRMKDYSGSGWNNMMPGMYETKLSLQSPVSLFANRQNFTWLGGQTAKARDDYLEFANGHDTSQTYLCPVGDTDMTYNRSHIISPMGKIYSKDAGTDEFAPDAGAPSYASSSFMKRRKWEGDGLGSYNASQEWHSDWHLVTFGGSYIAFRQSKYYDDKGAYTEHWNEIQAPSGQDFFHSHWNIYGTNASKTIILSNAELKAKGLGDVFHLRACTLSDFVDTSHTGTSYTLNIGYFDNTTSDGKPTLTKTSTSFSGTPCVGITLRPHLFASDATGAANRDLSPVYQDQNGAISAIADYGKELWYDVDVLFNFDEQSVKVFVDGYLQEEKDMNSKPGGGDWEPADLYGWNLTWNTGTIGISERTTITTLIDRACMHIPLSNGLIGSSLMGEGGVAPHIEQFSYTQSQNSASSFDFTIGDDTKLQSLLPLVNGSSKMEWKVIAFANDTLRPFYQGIMTGVDFKQNSANRSLDVTINSTDTLGVADTILPIYEEDSSKTTHMSLDAINNTQRRLENAGLYESLHLGTMPLKVSGAKLGLTYYDGTPEAEADVGSGDRFGPTSNARTISFSAHPIQMYICEDVDGPNYVDWSWWGWVGSRVEDTYYATDSFYHYRSNDSWRAIHFIDWMNQTTTNRVLFGIKTENEPGGSNYMTGTDMEGRFGILSHTDPTHGINGNQRATGQYGFLTNNMNGGGPIIEPAGVAQATSAWGGIRYANRVEDYNLNINNFKTNLHAYEFLNKDYDYQFLTFIEVTNLTGSDTQSDLTSIHAPGGFKIWTWEIQYNGHRHMTANEVDEWKNGNKGSSNPNGIRIDMRTNTWMARNSAGMMYSSNKNRTPRQILDNTYLRNSNDFPNTDNGFYHIGGRPIMFQYALQVYEKNEGVGETLHTAGQLFKPGDAITLVPNMDLTGASDDSLEMWKGGSSGNNEIENHQDLIGLTVTCTGYKPPVGSNDMAYIYFETPSELTIPNGNWDDTTNTPTGIHQRTSLELNDSILQRCQLHHYDYNKHLVMNRPYSRRNAANYHLLDHKAIGSVAWNIKPKFKDSAMIFAKGQSAIGNNSGAGVQPTQSVARAQSARWLRDLSHSPFFRAQFGIISKYPYWRHGAESALYRWNAQTYPNGYGTNGVESEGYTYPKHYGLAADYNTTDTTWTMEDVGLWYWIEKTKQEHRGYPIIDLVDYTNGDTEYIIPSGWTDPSNTDEMRFYEGSNGSVRMRRKSGSSFSVPSSIQKGSIIVTTGYPHPQMNGAWQVVSRWSTGWEVVKIDQFITDSDISGSTPNTSRITQYGDFTYKDPDRIICQYDNYSIFRIEQDATEYGLSEEYTIRHGSSHVDAYQYQDVTKCQELFDDIMQQEGTVWYGDFNLTGVKGNTRQWKKTETIHSLRKVDESNGYKHCWVLWSDMENVTLNTWSYNTLATANSHRHRKNFGLISPISENYKVSLSFEDQYDENGELMKYTELKIGEDLDIWEFDAESEPITGNKWSEINRECSGYNLYLPSPQRDWTRTGGSFCVVDCSKFWNLNTVGAGGRSGYASGGMSSLDDYDTEHHGFAFLIDSYWKNALTSEFTVGPGESSQVHSSDTTSTANPANTLGLKYHPNADYFFNDSTKLVGSVDIGDHYIEVYNNQIFKNDGMGIIVCKGGTLDLRDGRETELQVYTFKWNGKVTDTTNNVMYLGGSPTGATPATALNSSGGSLNDPTDFVFIKAYEDVVGPKTAKAALERDKVDWFSGSQVEIKYDATGQTDGAWNDVQVYTTPAAIFACRLLMNLEGRVKSAASGTYYINDKFRWLQTFAHCDNWASQLSLYNISDISNVPNTFNMTRTGIAYNDNFNGTNKGDTDNFGNVYDAKGQTLVTILNGLAKQGIVGDVYGDVLTFNWGIGRDNRLNFRPVLNSYHTFNRNNVLMSDLSTELRTQADYVRVYYKDNTKYIDYPSTPTTNNPRWYVEHKPMVGSAQEAQAIAQQLYQQHKSPSLQARVEVKRSLTGKETLRDLENHKMIGGGRYGYVQDTIAHTLAADSGVILSGANSYNFMHDQKAGLSPFSRFGGFQRWGRVNGTQGLNYGAANTGYGEVYHEIRSPRVDYAGYTDPDLSAYSSIDDVSNDYGVLRYPFLSQPAFAVIPLEKETMDSETARINRCITPLLFHAPYGDRYQGGGNLKITVTRSGSTYNVKGTLSGLLNVTGNNDYTIPAMWQDGGAIESEIEIPFLTQNYYKGIHELKFWMGKTHPDYVYTLSFYFDNAGAGDMSLSDGQSIEMECRIAPTYSYSQQLGGNWGANSLSNCVQVAHVENGMPKVSETTGEQLRLAIMISDDYTVTSHNDVRPIYDKPRPIYRLYLIDYSFAKTTTGTSGMPSDSEISSASGLNRSTTMAASLAHASNGYTKIDFRGSGLYEVTVPSTYSLAEKKLVLSIDSEYLDSMVSMTTGHHFHEISTLPSASTTKNRNDLEGGMGATDNIFTHDTTGQSIFPLGQCKESPTSVLMPADGMVAYLSPKIKIVEDLAIIPNTKCTLTDSNLELNNEEMVITEVNWTQPTDGIEQVSLNLEKQTGKYTYSMVKTFADMKLEKQKPPQKPLPPSPPPDDGDGGGGGGFPGGGGWDDWKPKPPMKPQGPQKGGDKWDGTRIGDKDNRGENNKQGINAMSQTVHRKMSGKMDLKNQGNADGSWGILGTAKPATTSSHDSSVGGIGIKLEPSSGSASESSAGISLPGLGGIATIETPSATTGEVQEFTTNFTIPNDMADNTIHITANASLPKPKGKAKATITVNSIDCGNGRTLSFQDATGGVYSATTESGVAYGSSVFNKIGLNGASTTTHLAQAIEQSINATVSEGYLDVSVVRTDNVLEITHGNAGGVKTPIRWETTNTAASEVRNELAIVDFDTGGGDAYLSTTVSIDGSDTSYTSNRKISNGDNQKEITLFPKQKISNVSAGSIVKITIKRTPGGTSCGGEDNALYQSVMLTGFDVKVRRNTSPSDKSYTKGNIRPY